MLKTHWKLGVILGLTVGVILLVLLVRYFPTASNQGYAPVQPIPFSHKLHAKVNKISCQYCHSTVERSKHASIPPLETCMNCHRVVKTESPYIQQIREAYEQKREFPWVYVNRQPNFVKTNFTHKRHVAKGVSCQTCHGEVQEMERVYQKEAMTMGWCMECHRGQTTPPEVLRRVYPNMRKPHGPVASVNCNTCHN